MLSHFKLSKRILISNQLADWTVGYKDFIPPTQNSQNPMFPRYVPGLAVPAEAAQVGDDVVIFRKSRISITSHTIMVDKSCIVAFWMDFGVVTCRSNAAEDIPHIFLFWEGHDASTSSSAPPSVKWKYLLTSTWTRDGRYYRLKFNVLLWIHRFHSWICRWSFLF